MNSGCLDYLLDEIVKYFCSKGFAADLMAASLIEIILGLLISWGLHYSYFFLRRYFEGHRLTCPKFITLPS